MICLAYRPFLDPLPADNYWLLLLVPLIVLVSIVYKAIKLEDLSRLPGQSVFLTVQILLFLGLAATALWLLTLLV